MASGPMTGGCISFSIASCPGKSNTRGETCRSGSSESIRVGFAAAAACAGSGRPRKSRLLRDRAEPDDWGRYRLAVDVASALIEYAFSVLDLDLLIGHTASANRRVERLARWFGATVVACRDGPEWMAASGWDEGGWALDRDAWKRSRRRERLGAPQKSEPIRKRVPRSGRYDRAELGR
jgi:hypothetical protein